MKFHYIKNRFNDMLSIFLVVILGITFYFFLLNFKVIFNAVKYVMGILTPIIYGVVIAYLLTPICNFLDSFFHKKLPKLIKDTKKLDKSCNFLSTFLGFAFFVMILIVLIALVIPQLIFTVTSMIDTLPQSVDNISDIAKKMIEKNTFLVKKTGFVWSDLVNYFEDFLKQNIIPNIDAIISGVSGGVAQFVKEISNLIIGLVVSVYCLNSRKKFSRQGKKIIYACMEEDKAKILMKQLRFADKAFSEFISGKLLEALAVGVICLIGTGFIKTQYSLLISVIIGVTNIIPFFGPFIGGIPACIILLFESPIKCFYFILFLFILVQIDGNFLGPKILSNSTGLTGFWIIFSIILFGGLFGIPGMLLGIPLFSVLYNIIRDVVNSKLTKKNLPTDTVEYAD